ncbi:hypothetical protein Q3G72_006806 [Acer saccharum]|nr:hypothetical protein Q3G72_006806 [Acer saccharum]
MEYGCKDSCKEGLEKPIQVESEANCEVQNADQKEKAPYGPWLLVSYGKQGNKFFKGRSGKAGNGSGFNTDKNGPDGKTSVSGNSSARNMEGGFTEVRSGKKSYFTNMSAKSMDGTLNLTSGSRFDILSQDMDTSMNEGIATKDLNAKGKFVLADITNLGSQSVKSGKWLKKNSRKGSTGDKMNSKVVNYQGTAGCSKGIKLVKGNFQDQKATDQETSMEGQDSASVLRHFHKEVSEFRDKGSEIGDGCVKQDIADMHIVSNFEVVASDLTEAMAVVTE